MCLKADVELRVGNEVREIQRQALGACPAYLVRGLGTQHPDVMHVESSYWLTKDQELADLDIVFSVGGGGQFAGRGVARFEINSQMQGDLRSLGPTALPTDRDSADFEAAVRTFTDEACGMCRDAVPEIISALREALDDHLAWLAKHRQSDESA